jgi:hypothetical protein
VIQTLIDDEVRCVELVDDLPSRTIWPVKIPPPQAAATGIRMPAALRS